MVKNVASGAAFLQALAKAGGPARPAEPRIRVKFSRWSSRSSGGIASHAGDHFLSRATGKPWSEILVCRSLQISYASGLLNQSDLDPGRADACSQRLRHCERIRCYVAPATSLITTGISEILSPPRAVWTVPLEAPLSAHG